MASNLKDSFQPLSPENGGEVENIEFITSRVSPVQWEEVNSNTASVCLNFSPNDNGSCVKRELQTLWEMFNSWLKPEEQTKEQMISQLVLEQFLKIGHSKDELAVKELWESSGQNLGNLMRGLTDECLKPPVMVHVSMHGQEALFTENMTLKEVIERFKEQQLVTASTLENERTHLPISQDMLLATGECQGDSKDCQDYSWNSSEEKVVILVENDMDSLFIIQTDNFHDHNEGAVSDEIRMDQRTRHDAARYQEESQSAASSGDVPMVQVQPGAISYEIPPNIRTPQDTARYQEDSQSAASSGDVPRMKVQPGAISDEIPLDLRTHQDTARYQVESQSEASSRDVPMVEVQPRISSGPAQTEDFPSHAANCTCDYHHKRLHRDTNSNLSDHKKGQKNERSFVCKTCHKGFCTVSDLRVHEIIHKEEKVFICPICGRPFSHKNNLKVHKRIHTGEKPYTCSKCQHSFRQSSSYHRHQRNCHKSD
ncbi:zinc finger and SCAN domain containing protein 4D-like [Microtus oregoni]|uniref:zinc finger and SCAN domain containing protein 4D-like n=1 Tax=Microtus oregoni TaxID=111838 RepID=UPI001BB1569D|nr:zinc finger and SCAN domain containing protein 4D-like [Microtus oregoni]